MRGVVAKRLRRSAEKLSINNRSSFKRIYKKLKKDHQKGYPNG